METKNETNEDNNSNNAQSTGNNKSSSSSPSITLSELSRRIHCPMNYKKKLPFMESIPKEATLSHIPWKLVVIQPNSTNDVNNENNETSSQEENNIFFPSCSYLDLRRQQNVSHFLDKKYFFTTSRLMIKSCFCFPLKKGFLGHEQIQRRDGMADD